MSRRHRRTRGSVAGLVVGNECLLMLYSLARCEQRGRAVRSWWTRKLSSLSAIHHLPTARTGCLAVGSCSEGLLRALQLASALPRCGMARPSSTSFDWPGPRPHKPALSLAWRRLVARDCYRSQTRPARRSLTSRLLMRTRQCAANDAPSSRLSLSALARRGGRSRTASLLATTDAGS